MNEVIKNINEIEIDVDGVLANMDGSYKKYIEDIIPDFSEEKYIKEWDMPDVQRDYPEAFERISKLWINPDFIYNLERFPKVVDGMQKLVKVIGNPSKIIVHTHIFDTGLVYKSREQWLKDLQRDSGVPFKIEISTGKNKNSRNSSDVIIEDNVTNLFRSVANYKFMIRRGHNRKYNELDMGIYEKGFVCDSFYNSVLRLDNILRSA